MTGTTIESRPSFPLGALAWATAATALDFVAVATATAHWAVLSILPWLAAVLAWWLLPRPFRAHFTETALEVDEPPVTIPYADLQGLLAPGRPANPYKAGPRAYPIQVLHPGGVLRVPAALDVPSDDVFFFLYRKFSSQTARDVHPSLAEYRRRKEREYGPARVWCYRARAHLGAGTQHPGLVAFFLALTLSGIPWIAWGVARKEEGWIAAGAVCGLLLGGLFSLLLWLVSRHSIAAPRLKAWRQASLVVCPDGLALHQGDMTGQLRWEEVRDVTYGKARSAPGLRGIVLKVAGAAILIADVYDHPLSLIHQQICYYWRGDPADADRVRDWGPSQSFDPDATFPPPGEGILPAD
jgi:hypothetical protein